MRGETAETIALQALDWVLGDDELRAVFLGSTGAAPAQFAGGTVPADILVAVLDFLCMKDAWVIAFCDSRDLAYTAPAEARVALPGRATPEWT